MSQYIVMPGTQTEELPPLMVGPGGITDSAGLLELATAMVDDEDLIHGTDEGESYEMRKFELALNLTHMYKVLVNQWQWGDSILHWIRQCETTFEHRDALRPLLHPDIWPHAGRTSFIRLLADKSVSVPGVTLEQAMGLRLTFREPPPISCVSDQFLVYLNSPVAGTAYDRWAQYSTPALLPPERFHFDVVDLES